MDKGVFAVNLSLFVGCLGANPEARFTKTQKAVTTFSLAVNRDFGTVQEDGKKPTDFIPVVTWGDLAEFCGNKLQKGIKVLVTGRMQVRSYTTEDGQKRWVTELVADLVAIDFAFAERQAERKKEAQNAG